MKLLAKRTSKYMNERLSYLLKFDDIRVLRILEMGQYTCLYSIVTILLAVKIDDLFPVYDKTKSTTQLLKEVFAHMLFLSVSIFYIKKLVKVVPPIGFLINPNYKVGSTSEYQGDIIFAIILIATQDRLNKKIIHLIELMK